VEKWRKNGEKKWTRSDAIHQTESGATMKIVSSIKESGGDNSQRVLSFYTLPCLMKI
jgi:hypothetical protein